MYRKSYGSEYKRHDAPQHKYDLHQEVHLLQRVNIDLISSLMHNKNKKNICFVVIQYNKPVPHKHKSFIFICFLILQKQFLTRNVVVFWQLGENVYSRISPTEPTNDCVDPTINEAHLLMQQDQVGISHPQESGPNRSGIDVERGIVIRYLEIV